ncbi:hypothetical protein BOTBODRAFT_48576 [Botryobasidium botryosum FD-172 SS1]|uniref:Uncharacterized protein n=1 Tax=Botryobasidium botryosum (strain FD-172 SS1) TaxID=930990 RepID=A0A067M8E4_BOTB1|nr:hypothetical protein BOTBODRAFT_48576 [Botryobasidium botryosum FD-172 SS1]
MAVLEYNSLALAKQRIDRDASYIDIEVGAMWKLTSGSLIIPEASLPGHRVQLNRPLTSLLPLPPHQLGAKDQQCSGEFGNGGSRLDGGLENRAKNGGVKKRDRWCSVARNNKTLSRSGSGRKVVIRFPSIPKPFSIASGGGGTNSPASKSRSQQRARGSMLSKKSEDILLEQRLNDPRDSDDGDRRRRRDNEREDPAVMNAAVP